MYNINHGESEKVKVKVAQSCPTPCDPRDFTVHGILQARILISPFSMIWGFPNSSVGKESICNAEDPGSIPGSGRPTGEGIGYPLQYSGLDNSMDCKSMGSQERADYFDWTS